MGPVQPNRPPAKLKHIVNLWSLVQYPSPKREWSLERKLRAVRDAGFDGFTELATPEHGRLAQNVLNVYQQLDPGLPRPERLTVLERIAKLEGFGVAGEGRA